MKRIIWLALISLLTIPSLAQGSYTEYNWTFTDMSFRYPASWGEPVQRFETETGRINLFLAESQVDTPETRPPEIPFITISLLRELPEADDVDLYEELENDLLGVDINPVGELPGTLLGQQSIATRGLSRDGEFFGMGQALQLDGDTGALIIYGRVPAAERDNFTAIFNAISNSIELTASAATQPQYGVLWYQNSTLLEGEDAYLDPGGIALSPDGHLYAVDAIQGLLRIDPSTGLVEDRISLGDFILPVDIAIAPDATIYVADLACNCVMVISDGAMIDTIEGFSLDAPLSIAVTDDNTLYASDIDEMGAIVRASGNINAVIEFDFPPVEQVFLSVDRDGNLIALGDNAIVYQLIDGVFTEQYQLARSIFATAIAVDASNNLLVATEGDAILVFDNQGNDIDQIGEVSFVRPQAGEILYPKGLVIAPDDTVYWIDGDGSYTNVMAMSRNVESGRIGSTNIVSGNVVQGVLDSTIRGQLWTFDALTGDIVTVSGLADLFSGDVDIALRLLDPTGQELTFVDDPEESDLLNPLDPQIDNLTLQRDGQYIVIVERVSGTGGYSLGLSIAEIVDVSGGSLELIGEISEAIPVQRWIFDGTGGQIVDISMTAISPTLDPILTLLNARGEIIAENDDALDSVSGLNARIEAFEIPSSGQYIIEAQRFDGEGAYQLRVEIE